MIEETEAIIFILALGIIVFLILNRENLNHIPKFSMLSFVFYLLSFGWFSSIAEGFFAPNLFNYLEHGCFAASSTLVVIWCYKVFLKKDPVKCQS